MQVFMQESIKATIITFIVVHKVSYKQYSNKKSVNVATTTFTDLF